MLYLNYAKEMKDGFILSFFADSDEDLKEISDGKEFVTKNGTNYGVPLASSTVVVTYPDKTKKTFVLLENGYWQESLIEQSGSLGNICGIPEQPLNLLEHGASNGYFHLAPYGRFLEGGGARPINYPAEKLAMLKELGFRIAEVTATPEQFEDIGNYRTLEDDKLYVHTFYDLTETPIWDEKGISLATIRNLLERPVDYPIAKWATISYVCKVIKGTNKNGVPVACVVNADCINTFEELAYFVFPGGNPAENYDSLKFLYSYWQPYEDTSIAFAVGSYPPIIRDDRINSIIHQVTEI